MVDQGEGDLRAQGSSGYGVTGATVPALQGTGYYQAQNPGCGHFLSFRDPGVSPGVPVILYYILSSARNVEVLTAVLAFPLQEGQ